MNKKRLLAGMIVLVLATVASAADVTSKWTSELAGRNGAAPVVTAYDLKTNGAEITGTVTSPEFNRGVGQPPTFAITNGKIDAGKVSFAVTRDVSGSASTIKYEFTLKGDEMVGKAIFPAMKGFDVRIRNVTARRSKA